MDTSPLVNLLDSSNYLLEDILKLCESELLLLLDLLIDQIKQSHGAELSHNVHHSKLIVNYSLHLENVVAMDKSSKIIGLVLKLLLLLFSALN